MKTRITILLLVLGLGAVAVGWVYESRLRERVEPRELVIPDNIDYFLTNFNYRAMNTEGSLDYSFDSPRLEHYPRNDVSRIETPSLQIFRDAELWQVDALNGEIEHRANLLSLRNQVVLQKSGPEALRMLTEHLRFEPDRDLVTSETKVLMLGPGSRIEADSAVFDLAGRVYRFDRARATYRNEDS